MTRYLPQPVDSKDCKDTESEDCDPLKEEGNVCHFSLGIHLELAIVCSFVHITELLIRELD